MRSSPYGEVKCWSAIDSVHGMPIICSVKPFFCCAQNFTSFYVPTPQAFFGQDAVRDVEDHTFADLNMPEMRLSAVVLC